MGTNKAFPSAFAGQLALYLGIHLGNILYGVEVYLYFKTMSIYLASKRARRKSDLFYALFSTVVFTLITIFIVLVWVIDGPQWVVDRDHPPRSVVFAYYDFSGALVVVLPLLTDGLMIYRCRIVWDSLRAVIIPIILWLATLALGIASVWIRGATLTNPFEKASARVSLSYYTLSVSLTTLLTCMICGRTVMLVVESMLPYSLAGIALLGSIAAGSPAVFGTLHLFGAMMCISPQMLILRVAAGRAWQEETIRPLQSTVLFTPEHGDTSSSNNSDGMGSVHLESLPGISPLTRESGEDGKV